MLAIVKLKGCIASAGVFHIIIGKFSYWKEPCPVVLLEVHKNTEVSFYCAVLPLGLTINLRVEGYEKSSFDSEKVTKWWPKLQGEKWTPVDNNGVWKAVMSYYHV